MFALKLGLVAASVLFASLAARRFGHSVAGTLAGMPMIAGPIMGFLLLQEEPDRVRSVALATLVCLPATIAHMVVFAHSARTLRWPAALLLANLVFVGGGWVLSKLELPPFVVCALALLAPVLGLAAMPRRSQTLSPVTIPQAELVLRVLAALAMAAAIMRGASFLPAIVSGLLLAAPITGNVLPCFTLPRHGVAATASLLWGFVRGLFGFVAFFVALYAALPWFGAGAAYALAWLAALGVALSVYSSAMVLSQARSP